jgi:predicted transporter
MNLNIVLWLGGMLFSLSIFVVKVGFGLGLGRIGWKGRLLTLLVYLVVFVLAAIFCESLIKILTPVVSQGPYLHAIMALGLIAWGVYVIRNLKVEELDCGFHSHLPSKNPKNPTVATDHSALFLLLPCPICLTAIIFSTWAALQVIKLPTFVVGLGLGVIFIILALLIYFSLKFFTVKSTLLARRLSLGLSMIGIGLYFIASIVIPSYIEAAKTIYESFLTEGNNMPTNDYLGVLGVLLVALLIGFFFNKSPEVKN